MRRKTLAVALAVVVLAGLVIGCGGGGASSASTRTKAGDPLSLDAACGRWSGSQSEACSYGYAGGHIEENEGHPPSYACRSYSSADLRACIVGYEVGLAAWRNYVAEEAKRIKFIGLSDVGTITSSDGEGTRFSEQFKIGRLHYASQLTPPQAVLNACDFNDPSTIASSVFAKGEAIITYEEGSLPYELNVFATGQEQGENGEAGHTAFRIGRTWQCGASAEGTDGVVNFHPGATIDFPLWIMGSVLSNAEPEIPWDKVDTWSIQGPGLLYDHIRGAGAVSCPEGNGNRFERLLLYGRPPVELPLLGGQYVTCEAA
jgi:hypothetical protein